LEIFMKALLYAGVAMLALSGGFAVAQTASETTTTQSTTMAPPPPANPPAPVGTPMPPPPGTLSTTHTVRAADAYGNQYDQRQTTYRNPNGVAEDSQTVTRTLVPPPPPPATTTTTTTNSSTTGPQ
jgi:hypothetical protein